jgi:hypothetical protein
MLKLLFILLLSLSSFANASEDILTFGEVAKVSGFPYDVVVSKIERDAGLFRKVEANGYIFRAYYGNDILDIRIVKELARQIKLLLNKRKTYKLSVYGYASRADTSFEGGKPALAHARAKHSKEALEKYLKGENVIVKVSGFEVLGKSNKSKDFGKYQYVEVRVHMNVAKGKDCNTTINQSFGDPTNDLKSLSLGGTSEVTLLFNSFSTPDRFTIVGLGLIDKTVSTQDYSDNNAMGSAIRYCYTESSKVLKVNDCPKLIIEMITGKILDKKTVKKILKNTAIPSLEIVHEQFVNYLKKSHQEFSKNPECVESWKSINANKIEEKLNLQYFESGTLRINISSACSNKNWELKIICK